VRLRKSSAGPVDVTTGSNPELVSSLSWMLADARERQLGCGGLPLNGTGFRSSGE